MAGRVECSRNRYIFCCYVAQSAKAHGTGTVYDVDEDGNLEFICSRTRSGGRSQNFVVVDLIISMNLLILTSQINIRSTNRW